MKIVKLLFSTDAKYRKFLVETEEGEQIELIRTHYTEYADSVRWGYMVEALFTFAHIDTPSVYRELENAFQEWQNAR